MKITKWDGKPISKPGIYTGIPLPKYHSAEICVGKSVSSSNLRTAWSESLAHMFDQWCCNPDRAEIEPNEGMTLGSAAHHLYLGEDNFDLSYIKQPDVYRDKVTAEEKKWTYAAGYCKDWRAKQLKAGRTIVTTAQFEKIKGMSRSLALDPLVQSGVLSGLVEHSLFVQDKETGLWLRGRPDVIPNDGDYVDLKTAREVSDLAIWGALKSRQYHMQGALIWHIADQLGIPFNGFTLIFVETDRPYCVRACPIHDEDLSRGLMQVRAMLRRIAECIERGVWPGPGAGDLRPMPLPKTEREFIDSRIAYEDKQ